MRFKDVFSIIGPSMVGPSSSHTAGAVRIGRAARRIFGAFPEEAEIIFYGSFAETYRGHGTDLAVVGGLMDYDTDDMRIRSSIELAEAAGMKLTFKTAQNVAFHPNTVMLKLKDGQREDTIAGASIGGGSVEMLRVNGFDVKFTMNYPVLLVFHDDVPGMVAHIARILEGGGVNIAYMDVDRKGRGGDAITVVESDEVVPASLIAHIEGLESVRRVVFADLTSKEGQS
ncbi:MULTISPECIES: L-serine ammonia-lyase, iron-sulfur-dependent subunit beta [Paenibacillus]|uniref:L-serine deaminase n=1 Tax=Paenibacillus campinasensis TaxID=66347 RepID=A0A268EYF7_9BACL|nr:MULTISPECIES: L-serine ammonia-lyase, iron-sulfur-dependent subunit beta [Paenibacillus]MUG65305.1 L-serine ammonia-lyase, iron-sulfur-dependent, subunit beta [Paenibacillus campinasensis]PAD78151.1 L-serine ammonia-lyase, iron-sulfur-dependent, subunit beta [Paenibacillus campinasensis]PAK48451.1 L-serine ammonia-lyase, iron-sulfur-dependent, subunit beta [Paenibacillus sp. 7541]